MVIELLLASWHDTLRLVTSRWAMIAGFGILLVEVVYVLFPVWRNLTAKLASDEVIRILALPVGGKVYPIFGLRGCVLFSIAVIGGTAVALFILMFAVMAVRRLILLPGLIR